MTQRIFPMVAYDDTASAIDWLTRAFGFEERGAEVRERSENVIRPPEEGPDGRLYTAEDLEGNRWMFRQRR